MTMRVRPHPTAEPRKYQTFKKEVYTLLRAKGLSKPRAEALLSKWTEYVHARWKAGRPPCAVSDHLARWEKEKIVCPCKKAGCKGKACKARKMVRGEVSQGGSVRKMTRAEVARFMVKINKKMAKYGRPGTMTTLDSKGRIASRVPIRDPDRPRPKGSCHYCKKSFGEGSEAVWCDSTCFNKWFNQKEWNAHLAYEEGLRKKSSRELHEILKSTKDSQTKRIIRRVLRTREVTGRDPRPRKQKRTPSLSIASGWIPEETMRWLDRLDKKGLGDSLTPNERRRLKAWRKSKRGKMA